MIIKCGRDEFAVNSQDIVKYNGSIYQLETRKVGSGWNQSIPVLAKGKAEKMIKNGELIFVKKEKSPMIKCELEYYKFNI